MIEDLLNAIKEYKSVMEFNCSDFNADKPRLYEEVRRLLSNIYEPMYFGPDVNLEQDGDQVSNKDLIKIGYKRVMEKTKELRQKFSKAVTNGTRSGSGKWVMEFYDDLVFIWGGSAATKPLQFGRESSVNHIKDLSFISNDEDGDSESSTTSPPSSSSTVYVVNNEELNVNDHEENDINNMGEEVSTEKPSLKRKNVVPKLIDCKRKNLERNLSSRERDSLLLKESKEDSHFRK